MNLVRSLHQPYTGRATGARCLMTRGIREASCTLGKREHFGHVHSTHDGLRVPVRMSGEAEAVTWREGSEGLWTRSPIAEGFLRRKHALPILVTSYEFGAMNTSEMIRTVGGHPFAVIQTIRFLEELDVISRRAASGGRHAREIRLTVKGLELMDTPINHWGRLFRKWGSLRASPNRTSVAEGKG